MGGMQQALGALQSPVRQEILALTWEGELAADEIAAAFEHSRQRTFACTREAARE